MANDLTSFYSLCFAQARRHGGHTGAVPPQMTACAPPNENCAPQSEDCAPKKLTDSGLLECKSRPKTPKLVFTALEFVSKNCFFAIFVNLHWILVNLHLGKSHEFWDVKQNLWKFWDEDLFLNFSCPHRIYINKLLVHLQNLFLPPQSRYSGAGPDFAAMVLPITTWNMATQVVPRRHNSVEKDIP